MLAGALRTSAILVRVAAAVAVVLTAQSSPCQESPGGIEDLNFSTPSSVVQGAGARAFGMGGAFLARADDATAASWNPAGLSYLARPEISLVGARNGVDSRTTDTLGVSRRDDRFSGTSPDFVSAAYPIRLGSTSGSVQVSYQRIIAFSGQRTLDRKDFNFRMESQGGFDTLSVGAGLRLARYLRAGFTINRWLNGFNETRERSGKRPMVQEVDFTLSGWNVNVGLIASPVENVNVGVIFKSSFTGDGHLWRRRSDGGIVTAELTSDDVRLDFPAALGAGLSWRPASPLTLSADYTQSFWSQGRIYNYFGFYEGGALESYDEVAYPTLKAVPPQHDTAQWRFGIEYVIVGERLSLPLRTGYFRDRQLFEDIEGQVPSYTGYTIGAGVVVGPVLVDVAYVRERGLYPGEAADPKSNETRVAIHRFLASLIVRFGGH